VLLTAPLAALRAVAATTQQPQEEPALDPSSANPGDRLLEKFFENTTHNHAGPPARGPPKHGRRHGRHGLLYTGRLSAGAREGGFPFGALQLGRARFAPLARVLRFIFRARCGAPRDKTLKFVKSEEAPRKTHLDESSSPTPLPHQTHARQTLIRQGFAPQERKRAKTVATANGNASVVMVLGGTTPSPRSASGARDGWRYPSAEDSGTSRLFS